MLIMLKGVVSNPAVVNLFGMKNLMEKLEVQG